MRKTLFGLIIVLCLLSVRLDAEIGPDDFRARVFQDPRLGTMPYRLFIPSGYDRNHEYPLVVFLHGSGRKGSDNRKQVGTPGATVWAEPDNQAAYPCFVLAPQCPNTDGWGRPKQMEGFPEITPVEKMLAIIDSLEQEFSIDTEREYITGQSGGGGGVLQALTLRPDRFAAAVLVCAGGRNSTEQMAELAKLFHQMPLWLFHGTKDTIIPVSQTQNMVKALKEVGGNPRYTEYPDAKHDCWLKAYAEPELLAWVFAQRRVNPATQTKIPPIEVTLPKASRLPDATDLKPDKTFLYKTVGGRELRLLVNYPKHWKLSDRRPLLLFFFGGGWNTGSPEGFQQQTAYFSSRGLVVARTDYRTKSRDGVMPNTCVEDARSAMRWVRSHPDQLGIDPHKIIASGGSAGGHLAACLAIRDCVEAQGDDLSVSTVPRALVLFNPVMRFAGIGPLEERVGNDTEIASKISPVHHLSKDTPPSIQFFGTKDRLKALGDEYTRKAKDICIRAEMYTAEGVGHTFWRRYPWDRSVLIAADRFLCSLGLLEGEPTLEEPTEEEFQAGLKAEQKRKSGKQGQPSRD